MGSSWTNDDRPAAPGWAGPAWELLLPSVDVPARSRGHSLAAALREAIRSGRLAAGTRLPSSRELAADLGVSRGLVTEVYARLTAESYLTGRQGSGTWIARLAFPTAPDRVSLPTIAPAPSPAPSPAPATGGSVPSPAPDQLTRIDFRPGLPAFSLFPRTAWSAAYQRALQDLPDRGFGYPDPRGLPELRAALADLLARRRGVAVHPDSVLVCSGVSQALTLIGQVCAVRGHRTVAVEDPGSPPEVPLLERTGLTVLPVGLDDCGIDMNTLRSTPTRLLVCTPSHQFPTGIAYPPDRRAELLAWARDVDGMIVEDDYDGEFRYDRAPVGALQGLAPDLVAYAGSISKSLAPGLRLGWIVPPPALYPDLVEAKKMTDLGNAVPDQAALAEFIRSGRYDQHLRRCQRAYRERRDALRGALAAHLPDVRMSGIAAGLHLIAHFPERYGQSSAVVAAAAEAGVVLHPLEEYTIRANDSSHPARQPLTRPAGARIVFGYPDLTPRRIAEGVSALAGALAVRR